MGTGSFLVSLSAFVLLYFGSFTFSLFPFSVQEFKSSRVQE